MKKRCDETKNYDVRNGFGKDNNNPKCSSIYGIPKILLEESGGRISFVENLMYFWIFVHEPIAPAARKKTC